MDRLVSSSLVATQPIGRSIVVAYKKVLRASGQQNANTHSLSFLHTLFLKHTLTLSLSILTHTHTLSHSLAHSHTHSLSLSSTLTHTLSHTYTRTYSYIHTHAHTLSISRLQALLGTVNTWKIIMNAW